MNREKTLRISLILVFAASVLMIFQIRCRHDDLVVKEKVCYNDVETIFLTCSSTAGCHQPGGESGYQFTDFNSIRKAITPFNAQKSAAYKAITGKGFKQLMPPGKALPENERILIRMWIDQGADSTRCISSILGTNSTTSSSLADKVCFKRDILPVLISSCGTARINGTTTVGCHDQATHKEGYTITSYASVMSNLVRAGSPTTSKLYTSISGNPSSENFMPPKPFTALSQAVRDSIFNWIKNGALDDVCVSSCDTTGTVTYQNQIAALISKNCISCHSGTNASKGILLDSYTGVKTYLDNGKLLAAVKATSIQMPPGYKITSCELREIELWKANGAIQN